MPEFKVKFIIEKRPSSPEQQAAGKRLFSRLIDRALASSDGFEIRREPISDSSAAAYAESGGQGDNLPACGGS